MSHYDFNQITLLIGPKLPEILDAFGIKYTTHSNRITFPCPLHGSDNAESLSIFTQPSQKGYNYNWRCFTNSCEETYGRSLLGFIRGLLSRDKEASWKDTVAFCKKYIDKPLEEYNLDIDKYRFIQTVNSLNSYVKYKFEMDRSYFRSKIDIPAQYYLKRGYTKHLLDRYDIGICHDPQKAFYNRVLVPIYDPSYKKITCVLARSIYDKCETCGEYHENGNCKQAPKWLNAGFTGYLLYNYWFAKNHIRNSGTCVLVEGCGDVWKLEEAGIFNSVALCTNTITQTQQLILEKSGATRVLLALDSDERGQEGANKIASKLERMYKVVKLNLPKKDLGEMNIDEIRECFRNR